MTYIDSSTPDTRPRPQIIIDAQEKETGPLFLNRPERWWAAGPNWRCANGHVVFNHYIRSESRRGNHCCYCDSTIWLTFPEDRCDLEAVDMFGENIAKRMEC